MIFFNNEMVFNGLEHLLHIKSLEFQHCFGSELFIQSLLKVLMPLGTLKIKTLSLEHNTLMNITPFQSLIQNIWNF